MRPLLLWTGVLLFLLACAPEGRAQEGCAGTLSRLMPYAGTYEDGRILDDPTVARALRRLMGAELEHLRANVSVRGPVDLISCDLVISGNAPHQGGSEEAIVAVNVSTGRVAAAIHSAGRIVVYADGDSYWDVPLAIKDWMAVVSTGNRYRSSLPPNARQVGPQGRP